MPSRRAALVAFVVVLALGLAALLAAAITTTSSTSQTLGVIPVYPIAPLMPHGGTACEEPVAVSEPIERVRFNVGTFGRPGPPLTVLINKWGGPQLAQGHVAAGWVDNGTPQVVPVRRIEPGQYIRICFRNDGRIRANVFGDLGTGTVGTKLSAQPRPTITPAQASVDGVSITGDMSIAFVTKRSHTLLSQIPKVFARAALFRPPFVGPWLFWILLAALVLGAPLMLWRALRRSLEATPGPPPEAGSGNGSDPLAAATLAEPPDRGDVAASSRGSTH